jgi:ABC-type sugar transport system ATPase subunit
MTDTRRQGLRIEGLRKHFGDKVVLDSIELELAEGTVFALLGPNGAGKTTMVRILSTLIPADSGDEFPDRGGLLQRFRRRGKRRGDRVCDAGVLFPNGSPV